MNDTHRHSEILLVEDNEGDVRLATHELGKNGASSRLHVTRDGVEALAFLLRLGQYADAPRVQT